jgi:phosphatidylserine/phosphatidylglycerophosphate/cardiolipin synthase-like enzyme
MKRNISLVRPSLKKYRNLILGISGVLLITAYPGYLLSRDLSAHFVIEKLYRAGEEIFADNNIEMDVFDNIATDSDNSFTEKVIEEIQNAKKEIIIAMYSFNIEEIRDALVEAKNRGVKITIYYPYAKSDVLDEFLRETKQILNVQYVGKYETEEDYYHMHHKFMIVDSSLEKRVLLTGPWNWSHYQQDLDPNILLITHDKEIILSFMNEVDRISRGLSGYNKFRDFAYVPWEKKINYANGDFVEIWWSPGRKFNSIESRAMDLIDQAEEKIDISMTIFDSYRISRKLIQRAKDGIKIRIIVDINTKDDETSNIPWIEKQIEQNNLSDYIKVYSGGKLPTEEMPEYSVFHHHNMIIDDKITFTSTANWTNGGFFLNDENSMVISSEKVTKDFQNIFNNYLKYINN